MLFIKILFVLMILFLIVNSYEINLHQTEWTNINDNNNEIQHDCIHIAISTEPDTIFGHFKFVHFPKSNFRQVISLCMSEWTSNWTLQKNLSSTSFTFAKLSELNITTHQLYLWSAPIDTIESYQEYLDQLSTSNKTFLSTTLFYNCTLPRFGPSCQYSIPMAQEEEFTSLHDLIYHSYLRTIYTPLSLTCYTHLQCDLGSTMLCLDWNYICDGFVQCIDGIDEKDCWQMEINKCKQNEYRCKNGQCIPSVFFNDDFADAECLDQSDRYLKNDNTLYISSLTDAQRPTFINEDTMCLGEVGIQNPTIGMPCQRQDYLVDFMLLHTEKSMSLICWLTLSNYLGLRYRVATPQYSHNCQGESCQKPINENCPDMFYMPSVPIVFGHIYLAYSKEYLTRQKQWTNVPEYLCYNEKFCGGFNPNQKVVIFNNTICRHVQDILPGTVLTRDGNKMISAYIRQISIVLSRCNTIFRNDSAFCDKQIMYQCVNSSKCITKSRLFDRYQDCDYGDDEIIERQILTDNVCLSETSQTHFICPKTKKCISQKLIRDSNCDCEQINDDHNTCSDEDVGVKHIRELISFPAICDGFRDLAPLMIDGQNHTDETECSKWVCNNTYTRCNGFWDCFNGADEVDCYPLLLSRLNCPTHSHLCISPKTSNFICLSMDKGNDGNIDCLGATDEPQLCRNDAGIYGSRFYCKPGDPHTPLCISDSWLCSNLSVLDCANNDAQKFCKLVHTKMLFPLNGCERKEVDVKHATDEILCNLYKFTPNAEIVHFSLGKTNNSILRRPFSYVLTYYPSLPCHRGIGLDVSIVNNDKNVIRQLCLCPQNYYGNDCQYQNQRVSLTMKLQTFSDSWQTPFTIIVSLVDDSHERIIHSYEQITYLPIQNCQTKFDIYLVYSTRPKNESKQYSIHIDVYEKFSLKYRGSLLVSIPFLFLPVQRIAVLLNIPHTSFDFKSCSMDKCINGECIRYFDDPNETTFCKCHSGYTGRYCTIKHNCTCSSDSLCIGILSNNRSICVCSINTWGPRCLIPDYICQSNETCQNGGQCVPIDQHVASAEKFECICPKDFFGDHCELTSNKIILSFEKDLILPETMLIHFIEVREKNDPEKGITFKKISINRNPISIYWPRPFHIIFVELFRKNYYLVFVDKIYNESTLIEKRIKSSDHCPNIQEIFNETFAKLHLIRRIKYFHVPCQTYSPQLSCFYDEVYFCLCVDFGNQRIANCFEFNHTSKRDCSGKSICENNGQCLQDSQTCPQTSMCVCPTCFYGTQCQFTTNGYSLSLDAILGYHIQTNIDIIHQTIIIQISITLTVLMSIIGLVNGIFLLITFQNKILWKSGCAIYLLGSSITTLFTIIIFFLKFIILLLSQMTFITDRSYLNFQCIITDYFLQTGLHMDQWLNACVALERAITTIKGINFNAKKSKKIAKFNLIILFIFIIGTNMIDPIHRRLIDENSNDEKRIWCIASYSSSIQIINKIINIFHICIPFLINIISTIIIIKKTTQLRSTAQAKEAYKKLLIQQIREHKHLLISSILLIILAIPRLIITFAAGCMKTPADSWLFLTGYFISFMPPMLSFSIFVLPSSLYKKEFRNTMNRYRQNIKSRFHFTS
ncbi:unnamed protein product [Adineta steineri]|uniref:Uncharacterized protein n=2 Tax=Adineta steineri TaxID=433720 RepID=A0A819T1Q4_9BILA|nr:unnamed protein product [Adineta steineri]